YRGMGRLAGTLVLCLLVACGGGSKKDKTTPGAGSGSGANAGGNQGQSMQDTGDPGGGGAGGGGGGSAGGAGGGVGDAGGGAGSAAVEPPVTFPNLDPDPTQARGQVEQQLAVAKQALMQNPP